MSVLSKDFHPQQTQQQQFFFRLLGKKEQKNYGKKIFFSQNIKIASEAFMY